MSGRVAGKVALITGAARGQGRAHAVRLAQEGADIIALDLAAPVASMGYPMGTKEELAETAALIEATGRRVVARVADVRDRDALQEVVDEGVRTLGGLDVVCASAGVSPPARPLWKIPADEWRDVIDINLTGVWNTLSVVVPPMLAHGRGGSIVVISSGAGLKGVPHLGAYSAAKGAVVQLAKTLANELASRQIRVNTIAPGTVDTPMVTANTQQFKLFRPDLADPTLEDCVEGFRAMMPMGQPWVDVDDIANALLFLASDESRYITGTVLPVDQGNLNRAV
jgi:(+)-trans-carveol dehydrogenase